MCLLNNAKVLGLIGLATKAGKLISGTEIVEENIKGRKAKLVIVAEDGSEKTKSNFEYLCNQYNVKFIVFESMINLSKAIGKENRAVICVKDKNLAEQIYKIYGGESFGKN